MKKSITAVLGLAMSATSMSGCSEKTIKPEVFEKDLPVLVMKLGEKKLLTSDCRHDCYSITGIRIDGSSYALAYKPGSALWLYRDNRNESISYYDEKVDGFLDGVTFDGTSPLLYSYGKQPVSEIRKAYQKMYQIDCSKLLRKLREMSR